MVMGVKKWKTKNSKSDQCDFLQNKTHNLNICKRFGYSKQVSHERTEIASLLVNC